MVLRVCFIANENVHTRKWIASALEKGYQVSWIIPVRPRELEDLPMQSSQLRIYDLSSNLRTIGYIKTLLLLRFLLMIEKPHVTHAHGLTYNGVILGLTKTKSVRVVSAWGTDVTLDLNRRFFRLVVRLILPKIALVTVCGKHLKKKLVDLGLLKKKKCVNVPFGVDLERFKPSPVPFRLRKYDIVSSRAHEFLYDLPTLIYAIQILHSKLEISPRLLLLSNGSQTEFLKRLVQQLKLEDSIEFRGRIPEEAIADSLAEARLYVSCALVDGISVSLLEAMSVGLIPIASRIESNEYWINPSNGRLFEPGNAVDLANKIQEIITLSDSELSSLSSANRHMVEEGASFEATIGRIDEIYRLAWKLSS